MPFDDDHDHTAFLAWLTGLPKAQRNALYNLLNTEQDERIAIVEWMWRQQQQAVKHWRANNSQLTERLRLFTQRPDLPVDRLPAYLALAQHQDSNKALAAALHVALERLDDLLHEDDGQAFKEARKVQHILRAVLSMNDGRPVTWDEGFIHRLWTQSWEEALREAGPVIGNADVAHMQQPIVFARTLLAMVFNPSPALDAHVSAEAANMASLTAWLNKHE